MLLMGSKPRTKAGASVYCNVPEQYKIQSKISYRSRKKVNEVRMLGQKVEGKKAGVTLLPTPTPKTWVS